MWKMVISRSGVTLVHRGPLLPRSTTTRPDPLLLRQLFTMLNLYYFCCCWSSQPWLNTKEKIMSRHRYLIQLHTHTHTYKANILKRHRKWMYSSKIVIMSLFWVSLENTWQEKQKDGIVYFNLLTQHEGGFGLLGRAKRKRVAFSILDRSFTCHCKRLLTCTRSF